MLGWIRKLISAVWSALVDMMLVAIIWELLLAGSSSKRRFAKDEHGFISSLLVGLALALGIFTVYGAWNPIVFITILGGITIYTLYVRERG